MKLDEGVRLREEDPCTARMCPKNAHRIVVSLSRFSVDMNRPRDKALYLGPEDAWGLDMWRVPPDDVMVEEARKRYDAFYEELRMLLEEVTARHGYAVVLDLHSYNHRRGGPNEPPDDPEENPDVNIGTATLRDPASWDSLIRNFLDDLRGFDYDGRHLDVRENVKFTGGFMARWIHEHFEGSVCVLSVEFKKFFMDEWTGMVDLPAVERLRTMLESAMPGLRKSLKEMGARDA